MGRWLLCTQITQITEKLHRWQQSNTNELEMTPKLLLNLRIVMVKSHTTHESLSCKLCPNVANCCAVKSDDATHEALHTIPYQYATPWCITNNAANQVDLLYRLSAHDQLITDYAHTHTHTHWTVSDCCQYSRVDILNSANMKLLNLLTVWLYFIYSCIT